MSSKLPVLKNEWELSENNVAGTTSDGHLGANQKSLYTAKEVLKGFSKNPWTVHSSSNSVNYTGDGGTVVTPIPDESTNDNQGILVGIEPSNITTDTPGGSYSTRSMTFDTSTEYVKMGNIHAFEYTDSFSVSFWFKKNAGGTTYAVTKLTSGLQGWGISVLSTGEINFILRNNVSNRINVQTATGGFDDDAWHHVVCTYDGSGVASGTSIYVDGTLQTLTTNTDTLAGNTIVFTSEFNISGYGNGTSGEFGGQIDDVAVYDVELTSDKVKAVYQGSSLFSEKSILFDGVNEYVTMGDQSELDFAHTSIFSISFWMKTTSTGAFTCLVSKVLTTGGAQPGYGIFHLGATGGLQLLLRNTTAGNSMSVNTAGGGWNDGAWHHVVCTWDGSISQAASNAHIYVDGNDETLSVVTDTLSLTISNSAPFLVGARGDVPQDFFDGFIDDVAVYDKELSLAEVQAIYNLGVPTDNELLSSSSNLIGYWTMGDGRGYTESAKSVWFGGVDEYATAGNVLDFTNDSDFSMGGWFLLTSGAGTQILMGKQQVFIGGYELAIGNGGYLRFSLWSISGFIQVTAGTANQWTDGKWHHFAVTWEGTAGVNATNAKLYVDGVVQASSGSGTVSSDGSNAGPFQISGRQGTTQVINNGYADDCFVYSKTLTPSEITTIYNDGDPTDLTTGGMPSDLAAYWKMGDGDTYPTLSDSADGYDLTMTNMEAADIVDPLIPDCTTNLNVGVMTNMESADITNTVPGAYPSDLRLLASSADLVGYWLMGDGITQGTPTDVWFSHNDLIWATPPAVHSWIVLQHPTKPTQFCIDLDRSSVSGRILSMYVSFGGHYTGGDLTTKPTAKDEVEAGVGQQWLGPILSAFNSWVHAWQNSDGTRTRLYIATSAGNGEGTFWLFDEADTNSDLWAQKEFAMIAHHKGISGGSVFEIDRMMATDAGSAAPSQTLSGSNVMSLLAGPLNDTSLSYFSNSSTRFNKPGTTQDEYVTMGDVDELSFERTDAFSISCWFRSLGHSSNTHVVGKRESGGTNRGYGLQLMSTGLLAFRLLNDSGGGNRIDKVTTAAYDDGNWHHVVVTYDGSSSASGLNMYIDGSLSSVTTDNDSLSATIDTTATFDISGLNSGTSQEFFGNIADVAVFNKELSSIEAASVYNSGAPSDLRLTSLSTNLVGYWLMGDGDTHPTLKDRATAAPILAAGSVLDRSVSGNDGTPTNMIDADFTTDTPGGVSTYSAAFDGVANPLTASNHISVGNVPELDFIHTDTFSASVWFKTTWTTDGRALCGKRNTGATSEGWEFQQGSASGIMAFVLQNGASNRIEVWTTNGGWSDGNWHHAVVTYDGSTNASGVSIYVDGSNEAISIQEDTLSATTTTTASFTIGARNDFFAFFNGNLDDVAVYNKELSAAEVADIYNAGAPTDNTLLDTYFNLVGYWGCGEKHNDGTMTNMEAEDIRGDSPANPLLLFKLGSQNADTHVGTADMITERAAASVPNELDATGVTGASIFPTITDLSASANDGTATNMDVGDLVGDTPGGISEVAMAFDGGNDYINIGNVPELSFDRLIPFSISAWVKHPASAANKLIFTKQLSSGAYPAYRLTLNNGSLEVELGQANGVNKLRVQTTASTYDDNAWHHVVMMYDGSSAASGVTFIVDGSIAPLTTISDTMTLSFANTGPVRIGSDDGGFGIWGGSLDEISVYNKELSVAEAQAIYNSGSPVDNRLLGSSANLVGYWQMGDPGVFGTGGALPMVPISIISGYGYRGMHGYLDDLFWGTDDLDSEPGTTYPDNDNIREFAQVSHVIHPWTGDSTPPYFGISTAEPHNTRDGHLTGVNDTPGDAKVQYFQMVGIDSGAPTQPTFHSWVVQDNPDLTGDQASPEYGPLTNISISNVWVEDSPFN